MRRGRRGLEALHVGHHLAQQPAEPVLLGGGHPVHDRLAYLPRQRAQPVDELPARGAEAQAAAAAVARVAAHADELPASQEGDDAGGGGLVEAQPRGQLVQREPFALAHVDQHPELLGGEAVAPESVADRLLDPAPRGPDEEADWFLLRQ